MSVSPFAAAAQGGSSSFPDENTHNVAHIHSNTNGHAGGHSQLQPPTLDDTSAHASRANGNHVALPSVSNVGMSSETCTAYLTASGEQQQEQHQRQRVGSENGPGEGFLRPHGSGRSTISSSTTLDDDLVAHQAALADEFLVYTPEVSSDPGGDGHTTYPVV